MLTAELVRTRLREGKLEIRPIKAAEEKRALEMGTTYIDLLRSQLGMPRGRIVQMLKGVPYGHRDKKLALGLQKLLFDRCVFEADGDEDFPSLRRALFQEAAKARASCEDDQYLDCSALSESFAKKRGWDVATLSERLFGDIRDAQCLQDFQALDAHALLHEYRLRQAQGVLLRAAKVEVYIHDPASEEVRLFFRELKFRRLLFAVCEEVNKDGAHGYRVRVSGPHSLFSSVTKYGLQLALCLPALRYLRRWDLDAEVRWGPSKRACRFQLSSENDREQLGVEATKQGMELAPELKQIIERMEGADSEWKVKLASKIVTVPGIGVCIPDLEFRDTEGNSVYFELLGFWSRDAVWKRIDMAAQGLSIPIIFGVPLRLRVSEQALEGVESASIFAFKGSIPIPRLLAAIRSVAEEKNVAIS